LRRYEVSFYDIVVVRDAISSSPCHRTGWSRWGKAKRFMLSFLIDFWKFLHVRKKFWLVPIILVLLSFTALMMVTHNSTVAPFTYVPF
jgi:hypothetical protein